MDDLKFAARLWTKNPSFAIVTTLTLALGLALNTITFGFVNALLFRPLALRDDAQLSALVAHNSQRGTILFSYPDYRDLASASSLEGLAALQECPLQIQAGHSSPKLVRGGLISDGGLELLGPAQLLGRRLNPNPSSPEVLIGERLWRTDFGADPSVLGSIINVDGIPATIVGVTSVRFRFIYGGYDVVARLVPTPALQDRTNRALQLVARRKPGVTPAQLDAELKTLAPKDWQINGPVYRNFVFSQARKMYPLLMAASALLLLIVCANLSNLLLAKVSARRREIAVRRALGSSRARIVRQLVTEGTVLGLAGGLLGFLLVVWARWWFISRYPELSDLAIDFRVFAYTALVSFLAGIIFGLLPSWTSSAPDLHAALKAGGRGSAGGRDPVLRRLLAVAQMAVALTLMAATGLLVRFGLDVHASDPGFQPHNIHTAEFSLSTARYPDAARQTVFARQLVARLLAAPGVGAASVSTQLPLLGGSAHAQLDAGGSSTIAISTFAAGPEYISTLGIRLLTGRNLTAEDRAATQPVALVNEELVRRLWPNGSAIGRRIRVDGGPWLEVIGVIAGARQALTQPAAPELITPFEQAPQPAFFISIRSAAAPGSVAAVLRQTVQELDPTLSSSNIRTMDEIIAEYFPRVMVFGLGLFAILALALASLGLYGVVSFLVAQRTHEIGIRIALGAGRGAILRLVLAQGLRFAVAGAFFGCAGALALGRLLASQLVGVNAADPPVLILVTLFLFAVAVVASLQPACRAAGLDTQTALRDE